jgi:hypothetical protein
MGEDSLTFGDVFEYDGNEYVYLGGSTEVIYAAKILPRDLTKELDSRCQRLISRNKSTPQNGIIFCYVILTTDELKDRAAFYGKPELNMFRLLSKNSKCFLNNEDLVKLKDDILNSRSVPVGLREIIQNTEVLLGE